MNIQQIIKLWNKSKYKTIMLQSLPCVNHIGEITWGTGIYHKGEKIHCGGEYEIEDYLLKIYKDSIFIFECVEEDYILFKQILKGVITNENNRLTKQNSKWRRNTK